MFKPRKSFSHHHTHSHNPLHRNQKERPHEYAVHSAYEHDFHRHHHREERFHHPEGIQYDHGSEQHHSHSEQSPKALRFEDGSLQCLGCPNECIMRVTKGGKVEGNHCPRGIEAAKHIKE